MSIIVLKGNSAQTRNTYYQFDTASEPIGEGGMGKVYRGRQINEQTNIGRDVAIKFMFEGLPQSVIDRARREASIRVVSENLVEMIDFIETTVQGPNNTIRYHYHVVSELLTGVMLADLLKGVTTTKDGRQIQFAQNLYKMYKEDRAAFALVIMKNIAAGIMTLHDKGFIHRDIDPTNIMVTEDGKIKLIDFGIAKKLPNHTSTTGDRLTTQDQTVTMTGQFIGKPHYAAPELVIGDIASQNESTDIYAMGILLYQLLVGKLPFTGPVSKVLQAQKETKTPVKHIEGMNHVADFRNVVAKATMKDQEKRYQTAAEFRVALDAVGTGNPIRQWIYYVAGAVAVVCIAIVCVLLWPGDNAQKDVKDELYHASTASEGWSHLQQQTDAASLYLQSRSYFNGVQLNDSIVIMKQNLSEIVHPDSLKAHELLETAYRQAPQDTKILYELGMDYYYGYDGGRGVEQNVDIAKVFFKQALVSAQQANDMPMQNRIQMMLNKYSTYD